MFPVNFRKERAKYYLECLKNGKSISPEQPTEWTVTEMVGLAGACFFAISSHGPLLRTALAKRQGKASESSQTAEHREADGELILNDIHAAIEFIGQLTMLISDQKYDEAFENFVQVGVSQDGQLERTVIPLTGCKEILGQDNW